MIPWRWARSAALAFGAAAACGALAHPPAQASLSLRQGTATFTARATFGAFTGRTDAVTGRVTSPTDARGATGWVELTLDSLRTGNGTRDRHLREALDTPAHPVARFDLDSLAYVDGAASAGSAAPTAVRLHGRFRVHGVARPVVATGALQPRSGGAWQLAAEFPVTLDEHGITKGLSRGFGAIRVQPVVQVRVTLEFAP